MGCCRLQRHLVKVKDEIGGALRQLSQEFKVEAVKLVTERVQAARDLVRTARQVHQSRKQARSDVFDYIERFYNTTHRHSTLGYISPIKFEETQET